MKEEEIFLGEMWSGTVEEVRWDLNEHAFVMLVKLPRTPAATSWHVVRFLGVVSLLFHDTAADRWNYAELTTAYASTSAYEDPSGKDDYLEVEIELWEYPMRIVCEGVEVDDVPVGLS